MKTDLVVAGHIIYKDRLLMIHHKKLDMWIPPGGHIEKDETPDDALIREIKEELNLDITLLNTIKISEEGNIVRQLALPIYSNVHNVGDHDHSCGFYLCTTDSIDKLFANKDELVNYEWFGENDLSDKRFAPDVRNIAHIAFKVYRELEAAPKVD